MMNFSYARQSSLLDDVRQFFRQGSALAILIMINAGIWFIIQIARVVAVLYVENGVALVDAVVWRNFGLPTFLPTLMMQRQWTVVSYMFIHTDFLHILFNMLWLYWFGRIFMSFLSSRQLVWIYFMGGLSGGLFYVFIFNVFPGFHGYIDRSQALGASAAVMAIVTAVSVYVPNYSVQLLFIGRIKILWIAGALFVFDFFMIQGNNAGGHIAHIGGAMFGAGYIMLYKFLKNTDLRARVSGTIHRMVTFIRSLTRETPPPPPPPNARPVTDEEYNRQKRENQMKIDAILDKISKGGYDSLTREEKEYLFRSSQKR